MLRKELAHVVILGGGFAGLAAARALNVRGVRVTMVDRCNHHLFQPLLYQVATAALAAPDVSTPIRQLLRHQRNLTVFMGEVQRIDVEGRRILLEGRYLDYDYLILATGMAQSYFGNDHWAAHAPSLKTIGEALDIRRRILRAFESAELEDHPAARRIWTTFVVIGGGPTGVELAGALAEIAGRTLAQDFRRFDPRTTRVILIEAGARVLATFPPELSQKAKEHLEALGIEVRLGGRVTDIGETYVAIGQDRIPTRTVLWAAGVRATSLTGELGTALDNAGRVLVADDLSVPCRPEIFVAGDLISKLQNGRPLPGVAQLAIQSGRAAARNIILGLRGKPRLPFVYKDKGMMATIGRNRAVAQMGPFRSSGIIAWFLWLIVHLLSLIGFRSRISVLMEWAFAYFTWNRRSRVILEAPSPPRAATVVPRAVPPSPPVAATAALPAAPFVPPAVAPAPPPAAPAPRAVTYPQPAVAYAQPPVPHAQPAVAHAQTAIASAPRAVPSGPRPVAPFTPPAVGPLTPPAVAPVAYPARAVANPAPPSIAPATRSTRPPPLPPSATGPRQTGSFPVVPTPDHRPARTASASRSPHPDHAHDRTTVDLVPPTESRGRRQR